MRQHTQVKAQTLVKIANLYLWIHREYLGRTYGRGARCSLDTMGTIAIMRETGDDLIWDRDLVHESGQRVLARMREAELARDVELVA